MSEHYTDDTLTVMMDESNIMFLFSEIEQDLDYLTDKRKAWVESMIANSATKSYKIRRSIVLSSILLLLILFVISLHLYLYTSKSVRIIQEDISSLSSGIIPPPLPVSTNAVFGRIYQNLNKLHDYLHKLVQAMLKITEKDFTGGFTPVSDKDMAGNALVNLQENLKISQAAEEKRKKEELERTWVAEGIARINDILRSSADKIEELAYLLIREIVEYTGSKLGAVYILNNEDPEKVYLEMTAVYAYDRKKHLKKELMTGEGLAGRCVQENETIYMTDVPGNYISIKSGLGETKPVSLLIVPLKLSDDSVHGAVEIASFSELQPYRIRFIETVGENIATSISKMKINLKTKKLLEHTKQQTEEMTSQEEEMRQNMEELKAIQEQSAIREEKLNKEIERLKTLLDLK